MDKESVKYIINVAKPYLEELAERCQQTSSLSIEEDMMVAYIKLVEGKDSNLGELQRIGKKAPIHGTAEGKLLLLNYDYEKLDRLVEDRGLEALTSNTITTIYELMAEVKKTYDRGYAVDNEECEEGLRAVAAPIMDITGKVAASLSVIGTSEKMGCEKIFEVSGIVREIAARISEEIKCEL